MPATCTNISLFFLWIWPTVCFCWKLGTHRVYTHCHRCCPPWCPQSPQAGLNVWRRWIWAPSQYNFAWDMCPRAEPLFLRVCSVLWGPFIPTPLTCPSSLPFSTQFLYIWACHKYCFQCFWRRTHEVCKDSHGSPRQQAQRGPYKSPFFHNFKTRWKMLRDSKFHLKTIKKVILKGHFLCTFQ